MIKVLCDKFPEETAMARRDFAIVTKTMQYDPPYWFKDDETGKEFKGLYGCIGWPGAVKDEKDQPPGYAAVIGVQKENERFRIVDECESPTPKLLIEKCLVMRQRWGFKTHPALFQVFIGDHLRFELIVAQFNVSITKGTDDSDAFIVSPPDDFENPKRFDIYFRQLQYAVTGPDAEKILFLGNMNILRNQLPEFKRDNPAVLAVGGLIHTLLGRKPWKVSTEPTVFEMPEL